MGVIKSRIWIRRNRPPFPNVRVRLQWLWTEDILCVVHTLAYMLLNWSSPQNCTVILTIKSHYLIRPETVTIRPSTKSVRWLLKPIVCFRLSHANHECYWCSCWMHVNIHTKRQSHSVAAQLAPDRGCFFFSWSENISTLGHDVHNNSALCCSSCALKSPFHHTRHCTAHLWDSNP